LDERCKTPLLGRAKEGIHLKVLSKERVVNCQRRGEEIIVKGRPASSEIISNPF
jgi:DNA-directed RNA polymerase subunit RPC12/RpoP